MTPEQYIDAVRLLPCCVSGKKPVSAHHVLGGSVMFKLGVRGRKKHSDYLAIPLHHDYHQGVNAIHAGVRTWELRYGTQVDHVTATGKILGVDPWAEAQREADESRSRRKYKRPDKVMPRFK